MRVTPLKRGKLTAIDQRFIRGPRTDPCEPLGQYTIYIEVKFLDKNGDTLIYPEVTGYVLPPPTGAPHPLIRKMRGVTRVSNHIICETLGAARQLLRAGEYFSSGRSRQAMETIIKAIMNWKTDRHVVGEFVNFLIEHPCTDCSWPCGIRAPGDFSNETDVFLYGARGIRHNHLPDIDERAVRVFVSRLTCVNPEALLQEEIVWTMEMDVYYGGHTYVRKLKGDSPPHPHVPNRDHGGVCLDLEVRQLAKTFIKHNMYKEAVDCILNAMAVVVPRGMYQDHIFSYYDVTMCGHCGQVIHQDGDNRCRGCNRSMCPKCQPDNVEVDGNDPLYKGMKSGTYCQSCARGLRRQVERAAARLLMETQPERIGRMRRALMLRDAALVAGKE